MGYNKEQLKKDLYNLGIHPGDVVLMHSSFKSLGKLEGGAKTFFEGFIELLGEEGTLIVPALSFDTVKESSPVFNLKETSSCVGYLSEYFRTKVDGVKRSIHATHSCCAYGKFADEITTGHELDLTPVGENSPFAKLPKYNGKILMLGCGTRCNTLMHGVEETVENPYVLDKNYTINYTLVVGDKVLHQTAHRHHFIDENGKHIEQRYDRVVDLLSKKEVSFGKVLEANCVLMSAKAVWEKGQSKMRENPIYFVNYHKD